MHTYFPNALLYEPNRQSIVKIFGIGGVYRKGCHITKISSLGIIGLRNTSIDSLCCIQNLLLKLIRQIELCQYRVHLGIVITDLTQHIYNFASWRFISLQPIGYTEYHFVTIRDIGILLTWKEYVHRQLARIGVNKDSRATYLSHTNILLTATLQYCNDSTFGMVPLAMCLTLQNNLYTVTIQSIARITLIDIYLILQLLDFDIRRA